MTRLILISGSLRKHSFNTRLLQHFSDRIADRCIVDFLEPNTVNLPLFDQDLEADPAVIHNVAVLHARISKSDGIIVASPEFNGQLTAYLKNTIDWVSRMGYIDPSFGSPFCDRPVLLCSASTGSSGGSVAIAHARALFGYVGANVIGDTLCLPYAQKIWDDSTGYMFEPYFEERIEAATSRVLTLANDFFLRQQNHGD